MYHCCPIMSGCTDRLFAHTPKQQSHITIEGINMLVENVTQDEIRLRISK